MWLLGDSLGVADTGMLHEFRTTVAETQDGAARAGATGLAMKAALSGVAAFATPTASVEGRAPREPASLPVRHCLWLPGAYILPRYRLVRLPPPAHKRGAQ